MTHAPSASALFSRYAVAGVVAAITTLAFVGPSHAQTLTWSGTGSFLGPGTWNSSNSNWWNGTANQTWTAGNIAAFGVSTGTGSTVTVSGSQSVSGIVFNPLSVTGATAGSIFTLTGGTIGIGDGNSILASGTQASSRSGLHMITSSLVGSNLSIGRAPGGSTSTTANVGVVLNGTNNLAGTLTVGGTTILFANASSVNGVSTINVLAGSSFGANAAGIFNSNIQLAAGSSMATGLSTGTFTGTVGLLGDGVSFSGNGAPVNVFQGPIVDSSGGAAKTLSLTKRGILVFTGSSTFSGTYAQNGVNSPWGATTILDGGDNRLSANSSFSILTANQVLVLGTSSAINQTFANFSSTASGSTSSVQGGSSGTSTLTVNLQSGTSTFFGSLGGTQYQDGSLSGGGFISNPNGNNLALVKSGGGTFVLSGSSSYVGGTRISGGVLNLGNASALGTVGTISFGGGTLQFSGSNTVDYSNRFSTAASQAYSLDTNGQTVSISTALTSVGGSLAKLGTGTLALTAANTFDGGTVIGNGSLVLDGGNNRLLSTGAVTIGSSAAAGRLVLGGASAVSQTVGSLVTTGSGGSVVGGNASASTLIVDQASGAGAFAGSLGGAATNENNIAFEKRGAGTLTLSGSNSLSGGMTLTAGQLNVNNNSALGGAANVFTIAGGTLDNTSGGSITVAGNNAQNWNGDFTFAGSNPLNLGTGAVTLSASRQVTVTSSTLTVGGGIAGSGFGLTKAGNGVLALTGSSTFDGGVTLNAGTVFLGNANALGTGTLTAGGGTLNSSSLGNTVTIANAIAVNSPLTVTYGFGNTYSGALTGASDITFTGSNALFLNQNVADYSGVIVISASTATNFVRIANSTSGTTWQTQRIDLQGSTVAARAGLNGTQRLGAVSGAAGTVLATGNGAVTYDVGYANTDATFAGRITDATSGTTVTSIQKSGAGTWTLSGSNSYSGATTVSAGRLHIAPTGSLNSTSGITINGGELKYNSATALSAPITFTAGTLSGTGTIGTAVTVATNDVLSPGNSPGTQAYSAGLTWAPGGTYRWELEALTGSAGTTWDLIDITSGTFSLATLGTAGASRFTLDLTTLGAGGALGPLASGYDGGSYSLLIADFAGASLTVPNGFSTAAGSDLTPLFSLNLGNWQSPQPDVGNMSVRINSGGTGLELVIVPEPGAVALAGIGAGLAGWTILKRRRTSQSRRS